ncbi:MAG: tetratricopeptide repeat protein [Nitratireductor sp.]|nr:tetratricopeptide repeat protein [Nitratireductor sp.]MCB1456330.1 tetratricopeptide repeat protein [Nitratireductor sp.]
MKRPLRLRLSSSSFALALALGLATGTAFAAAAQANTGDEIPIREVVAQSSLSGSFLAAQVAGNDNDDENAVAFYERAVELDPDNGELKRLLFLALTANGRIQDAVAVARKMPQTGDDTAVTRLVVAVDALRQKSWSKVGETLNKTTGGDLDVMVEDLLKAWAMYGAGDIDGAIKSAQNSDGPDWVQVVRNYHAGLMASAASRDSEAIPLLEKATENEAAAAVLSETFLRAIEALVRAQVRTGALDDAEKTLERGFSLLPNHPPFATLKTQLAEKKALNPLVTSATQGGAEVFYNVGSAISRQGGAPLAQSYLQLADNLNPGSDVVALALAGVFENQKRPERANVFYEKVDAKSPFHRRAALEYALNLNTMKENDKAEKMLRDLIAEDPEDLIAYSTLGGVLSQQEKYREAADVYDSAIARIADPQPYQWNLFYRRAIAYERLKEWDKAEPSFKKAIELSPNQADVLNYLGYSWVDMGINLDEGMDLIRKAVELKPRSGFIVDSLGWAYYKLGKYDEAVKELERAVELMPQDSVVNDHLGDAYWKVGRKLEATFQWNHALVGKPEPEEEKKIRLKLEKGLVETTDAGSTAQ